MGRKSLWLVTLLLLSACSPSVEDTLMQDQTVQLFERMSGSVAYSEAFFSGNEAEAIADLVQSECPDIGASFIRSTVKGRGADLVAYSAPEGEVLCFIFRPHDPDVRTESQAPEGVIASVNGVPITQEQVQAALAQLPEDQQSADLVLNSVINDELLRQEAASVDVTQEEIDAQAGDAARARLVKLLEVRLTAEDVNVSEENARDYYMQNTNQFIQSEQAVMRHLLIAADGRSETAMLDRARDVASLVNGSDFCQLVTEYSDDKTEDCGTYIVPRGVVHPDIENAAFSTPSGQTSIVQTPAGIHFVQNVQTVPAQVVPYADITSELQSSLVNTVLQNRLNLYLQMLRADAQIVLYTT